MSIPKTTPARIQIQDVSPQVDCGRYPVKRTVGDEVEVTARIFRDGHETLGAAVRHKGPDATRWSETPLEPLGNDVWAGSFEVDRPGLWSFRIEAWVDRVASFQEELRRKVAAGQADLTSELSEGAVLLGEDELTVEQALAAPAGQRAEKAWSATYSVDVDRVLGRFGSWYELFPRSWGGFAGVRELLPRFAELGFDVLYLPPIHPIGHTNRKGRNNAETAEPGDVGSPWAIGSEEGGHDAIDPSLGTEKEFRALVADAQELGIEIALDFAIQCSPDHPWLKEHPEWFHRRPDGTLKYAENPPKRYQDIYNVDFGSEDWRGLWQALLDVVLHWVGCGVTVFRVDNPHTKPLPFWEWLIGEVRREHPEVIFLSEAFTRPAPMTTLAKAGFAQSYTYFTWKNTRWELLEFLGQLLEWREFYRPNCFANTPDILHEYLQTGGRPAFEARLVLAATLSPSLRHLLRLRALRERARAAGLRGVPQLGEVRAEAAEARRAAAAARRPGSTRRGGRTRRCSGSIRSRSSRPRTSGSSPSSSDAARTPSSRSSTSTRRRRRSASASCRSRPGSRRPTRFATCCRTRRGRGGSAATTSSSAPARATC